MNKNELLKMKGREKIENLMVEISDINCLLSFDGTIPTMMSVIIQHNEEV